MHECSALPEVLNKFSCVVLLEHVDMCTTDIQFLNFFTH